MSRRPNAGTRRVLGLMAELTLRAQSQLPRPQTQEGPSHVTTEVVAQVEAARSHARSAVTVPPLARLAGIKRLVLRGARVFTIPQVAATDSLANAVVTLAAEVRTMQDAALAKALALETGLDESVSALQRQLIEQQLLSEQLRGTLESTRQELATLRADTRQELATLRADTRQELATLRAEEGDAYQQLRADLRRQQASTARLVREVRAAVADGRDAASLPVFESVQGALDAQFYDEFEAAFRGSRETIKELQREHIPAVKPLATLTAPVVDLGCGRGEWLELLLDEGIPAYGVDTNALFAEQGRARGLDIRVADAIAHLESLPPQSTGVVTAFHLVEHLPQDVVVRLLDAALDALRPGGLLLLETPNPTNLEVGAATFYLDPTHLRPVHHQYLRFLSEARGYVDSEVRFLHPEDEDQRPPEAADPRLSALLAKAAWALAGPRDYALLARKASASS